MCNSTFAQNYATREISARAQRDHIYICQLRARLRYSYDVCYARSLLVAAKCNYFLTNDGVNAPTNSCIHFKSVTYQCIFWPSRETRYVHRLIDGILQRVARAAAFGILCAIDIYMQWSNYKWQTLYISCYRPRARSQSISFKLY